MKQKNTKEQTFAEPMSFLFAASLIAFCTFFSSLCISNRNPWTQNQENQKIIKRNWLGFEIEKGIPRIWRSMLRHSWRSLRCQSLNSCCGFGFGFRMFITFSIPTDPKIENWFFKDRKELEFAHKGNYFKISSFEKFCEDSILLKQSVLWLFCEDYSTFFHTHTSSTKSVVLTILEEVNDILKTRIFIQSLYKF